MCNLYSMTASVDEMKRLFGSFEGETRNLPAFAEIYPGKPAPILRRSEAGGLKLEVMEWGFPGPAAARGRPVTNIRNLASPFWRSALGRPDRRCIVPVTRFFDYAGPLAVTEALFKAYRASATPAEIDPFIIRVHSPEQRVYKELLFALRSTGTIAAGWSRDDYHRAVLAGDVEQAGVFAFTYADLSGFGAWIYKASEGPKKLIDVAKPWTRFSSKVQKLAA